MWVEKYRPKNPSLLVGNDDTRSQFISWLKKWKKGSKQALLLGPPGIGKTTLVYASAQLLGYTIIELNASDARTKEKLRKALAPSIVSTSVLNEKLLIFLDEVDGIYGRQDYQGLDFVQSLLKESSIPVILAANFEDNTKVKKLVSKCLTFLFKRVPPRLVEMLLKSIASREDLQIEESVFHSIVLKADGDIRAAVNNLQMGYSIKDGQTAKLFFNRDQRISLKDASNILFNSTSSDVSFHAFRRCNSNIEEKIQVLFSSILNSKLDPETLTKALNALSKADELAGRIRRTQEWRLLRYFDEILVYSLMAVLPRGEVKYSEYKFPWNLQLRIWNDSRILKEIGQKLGKLINTSSKEAIIDYLPYLLYTLKDKKMVESVSKQLALSESGERVIQKEISRLRRP